MDKLCFLGIMSGRVVPARLIWRGGVSALPSLKAYSIADLLSSPPPWRRGLPGSEGLVVPGAHPPPHHLLSARDPGPAPSLTLFCSFSECPSRVLDNSLLVVHFCVDPLPQAGTGVRTGPGGSGHTAVTPSALVSNSVSNREPQLSVSRHQP